MEYREIGQSGKKISIVGFGTGDNAGLMVTGDPGDQRRAVEHALELGINYFDTAPAYGQTRSETNLGRVLAEAGVRPVICTKVEVMPEHLDDIAGRVVETVEASLTRLGVDWVDVVMIHNPPHLRTDAGSPAWAHLSINDFIGSRGCLEGLEKLHRDGKVDLFGFTLDSLDMEAVDACLETGRFAFINAWYNLINPSSGVDLPRGLQVDYDFKNVIAHAHAHGTGVAAIGPHARGVLTEHAIAGGGRHALATGGLTNNQDAYHAMVAQAQQMSFLSRHGEQTMNEAALRFVLSTPGVLTVLGGFSELSHVDEMVSSASGEPLSEQDMARIEMVWRGNFGRS